MIKIHAIRTGLTRVRLAQLRRRSGGTLRVLVDRVWSEWLPIYAWLIEHPEGNILVDVGETARVMEPGYFPRWHPFFRLAAGFDVKPKDEIGPQLQKLGLPTDHVQTVVLTHLHTDHAGGLHHFSANTRFLAAKEEYATAVGSFGKLLGYLPHRWPTWFAPAPIVFQQVPFGPFPQYCPLTQAGDVVIVPTPGHTPHHVSVVVTTGDMAYFLAGDATYTEAQLLGKWPDGVCSKPRVHVETLEKIATFTMARPTVYLPSHDPESAERLRGRRITRS